MSPHSTPPPDSRRFLSPSSSSPKSFLVPQTHKQHTHPQRNDDKEELPRFGTFSASPPSSCPSPSPSPSSSSSSSSSRPPIDLLWHFASSAIGMQTPEDYRPSTSSAGDSDPFRLHRHQTKAKNERSRNVSTTIPAAESVYSDRFTNRSSGLLDAISPFPSSAFVPKPGSEATFRWFKSGPLAEGLVSDVTLHRPCCWLTESLKMQTDMACLEGSVVPTNIKGWKIIKAGMDHVFGRSIVPRTTNQRRLATTFHQLKDELQSRDNFERRNDFIRATTHQNVVDSNSGINNENTNPEVCLKPEKQKGDLKVSLSQHNAIAGAMAGTCVSLCLHPIDTVKTVIQAQTCGQRSLLQTVLNLTSDRGFLGLYRGLASNVASSAPISAIYTFTYETVKAALLTRLPKEYHAIAHCTAGGCASIATSIVYTPSECVKQRMQVGTLYHNSWQAFLGILKTGGLSVLYSGWRAVLCRNVPQSIIKFYTYEGLKHCALDGTAVGTPLNTWQMLAFGGLAGSTAALFTTPFDVIKTRLQTQVAGSLLHQRGVLHTFQCIAATEGLSGLYRGLIPRLIIYMSQGAIFFTSYEFFKQLLLVETQKVVAANRRNMVSDGEVIGST